MRLAGLKRVDQDALAALYSEGLRARDPVKVAHKIERIARARGRLTTDVAPTTALTMAAELCQRHGAIAEALRLVETGLAMRAPDDDRTSAPALHAVLLAESGRKPEALSLLEKLRPQIGVSYEASSAVPDALVQIGETTQALEWLSDAIHELSPRALGEEADPVDRGLLQVLLTTRTRLRAGAGLPPDHLDILATPAASPDLEEGVRLGRIALLYWPRTQFEAFAAMWPDLAAGYGNGSWAGHRAQVEKMLVAYSSGGVKLTVVSADLDDFLEYATEQGLDPKSAEARSAYAAELGHRRQGVDYPPSGRGAPCWCGSGRRYRRCCGARSRLTGLRAAVGASAGPGSGGAAGA